MNYATDDYYASYELIFPERSCAFTEQEERFFAEGDALASSAENGDWALEGETDDSHRLPRRKTA